VVFAVLLLTAQFGATWHLLGHEVGTPQNTVCTTCIAAEQLSSGCIDAQPTTRIAFAQANYDHAECNDYRSAHTLASRQRGPPEFH